MYQFINKNIVKLLDAIERSKDIDPYLKMAEMFKVVKVSDNYEYQNIYRKYWQLNAARLSDHYCNHYFQTMENNRYNKHIDIEEVLKAMYEVPSNSKGQKTIQFSFATKLIHTIDNTRPIYDSLVGDFYFLPQIKSSWEYKKKISVYMTIYNFLLNEHKRVLDKGLLSESIEKFREHFRIPPAYTDQKIIDTLLWKFSSYARGGAIMFGKIKYS